MLRIEVEKVRICKLYDATGNLWALGVHVIMLTDNRQLVYQAVEDGAWDIYIETIAEVIKRIIWHHEYIRD